MRFKLKRQLKMARERIKKKRLRLRNYKLRFQMYMKLTVHFLQCLAVIVIYELPFLTGNFGWLMGLFGSDPQIYLSSLDCILGHYFKDVFYVKVLINIIVPYVFAIWIFLSWLLFSRKIKFGFQKMLAYLIILYYVQAIWQVRLGL